ncbi:MAE_28990/MAE_18760 family HEPN-like nuclease [Mycolicibacterium sp. P9-22]|uniref:MAE_28990/MAE_18760 family HEPN-like nuclease n=1 Tax=Mycolicibacterium sp. P9-22 TaxID=2024613 RepID=UPI0011EFC0D4|nr:MAE_28990/MAE_18760 family HEPN-like nuclease [Mycolicibacterium sp. P9-22]KAA0115093.1 hypothetical protein CIW51_17635 [Mycolicibacterium sp. P9-22]
MPTELSAFFDERRAEIDAYIKLLEGLEVAAKSGAPRLKDTNAAITPEQIKILNSSLYLQLYNLVEATVSRCLDAIAGTLSREQLKPNELNPTLRQEWVRFIARTHIDLNSGNRLQAALDLCDHLLGELPISAFRIEPGGGGNWDDAAIEQMCKRVGCKLDIPRAVRSAVKRPVRDEMGALKLVKDRRNSLAHGSLSFSDCSDGVSFAELSQLANSVYGYLEAAIASFDNYIDLISTRATQSTAGLAV